ncbi:MAG TPA: Fur family transcriptional regulator [Phycisphaerales bacterium]|nr:Fur family transcriptional regulator [Phycisphaerales bacterium]
MSASSQPGHAIEAPLEVFEPLCSVFRKKLKAEGLKYTPERAQVLDTVLSFDGLFEADRVLETVRKSGFRVSKATVYRTIKLLQEAGIIQRALFDEEQTHYQVIYGKRANDSIIRMDTGQTIEIDVPELAALRDRICRERGLDPKGHRLTIFAVKPDGQASGA